MSGKYTHKIILFSEEGFTGDARVIMRNTILEFNEGVREIYQSAIIEKGGYKFQQIDSEPEMFYVRTAEEYVRPVYGDKCILIPKLKSFNTLGHTLKTE